MVHPPEPDSTEAPDAPAHMDPVLRIFFGSSATVPIGPLRTLRLVALGLFFENYDIGLVNSALKQISEDLGMEPGETGYYTGAIRLGGLAALLVIALADRMGRRRVFLLSLLGMTVGTFLTAFTQSPAQFVSIQVLTRAFMLTGAVLAVVILVEEFPAHQRGAAIGLLSLIGGLGYGLGAGVYAAVDLLPYGWRAMYAVGVLPLLVLPFFRRTLRETRRFEHHVAELVDKPVGLFTWAEPMIELWRTHPRRAAAMSLAGMLGAMGSIAVFQYTSFFVQDVHGWAPGQYSLLVLGAGLIGMLGTLLGGRGSDRFGRRRVGFAGLALAPVFAWLIFTGPSSTLALCWGLYVLCMAAGDVVLRAMAAELFPTSHRSTSGGVLIAVQAVGFGTGLIGVSLLIQAVDMGTAVAWMSTASAIAAVCVLFLPETHDQELEAITGEAALDRSEAVSSRSVDDPSP